MREDIQCLRGIAIILVFLFHLFPNLFPNGFLGVDIFFVISGFLMAKNLTHSELRNSSDFFTFYYKRFRRILPLYYLVIFLTVIMFHLYLGDFLWENNNRYSLASLFLVTNQLVIHDQSDYFNEFLAERDSVNVFLHLWSLSVEMQFYLLVPVIFFGLQFLKHDRFKFIAVSLITVFGFIGFSLVMEKFAFNFMLLRLWQFSSGFIALFRMKINENSSPKTLDDSKTDSLKIPVTKEDLVIISVAIISCCLLPYRIPVQTLRPLVTSAAAILVGCESNNFKLLESKTLSYIGDISYVMYLVHWPIIAIFSSSTLHGYLFCFLATLLSSVLLHHLFEKRYLKMEWQVMVPLLIALILFNSYLQSSVRKHNFWNAQFPADQQNIIDKNKAMLLFSWTNDSVSMECFEDNLVELFDKGIKFAFGSCPRGNGTTSIMLIGNSYTLSFKSLIRDSFHNNFSDFRYISLSQGYGFYNDSTVSRRNMEIFRERVERYKPDVLFITSKHSSSLQSPIKDNDELLEQMNENIAFFEKFVKKIYILGSHPVYRSNFIGFFLQYIVNRPDEIESLHINKQASDYQLRNVKRRFSMIKCTKCHFYDLSYLFMENDKYLTFDRDEMLSYVDNTVHLSSPGVELCNPVFEKIAKEIMDGM